jgi:hypothetical protein
MNLETYLKQLVTYQESFAWSLTESDKIADQIIHLEKQKTFNPDKYNKLSSKLLELQQRYSRDRANYKKAKIQLKKYFKTKYDIDIIGILEDDIDLAK